MGTWNKINNDSPLGVPKDAFHFKSKHKITILSMYHSMNYTKWSILDTQYRLQFQWKNSYSKFGNRITIHHRCKYSLKFKQNLAYRNKTQKEPAADNAYTHLWFHSILLYLCIRERLFILNKIYVFLFMGLYVIRIDVSVFEYLVRSYSI